MAEETKAIYSRSKMRWALLILSVLLPGVAACAASGDAGQKRLDELTSELAKVRSQTAALGERLDALEIQRATPRTANEASSPTTAARSAPQPAHAPPPPPDRPTLDVVKLGPDAPVDGVDGLDGGGRVVLRSTGNGAVIEDASAGSKPDPKADKGYEQALEFYRKGQYDKALEALATFTARFPDHPNSENALLLRADCYVAQADFRRASETFETYVASYPKGAKVPDTLLKLSQTYGKLGDSAAADGAATKLRENFPSSEATRKLGRSSAPKKP